MTNEKMTYVKALENALTLEMPEDVRERLEALKASLEKRAAYKTVNVPKAKREADEFMEQVYAKLAESTDVMRSGDLAKELEVSSQKVTAALIKLVRAERVVKIVEKRVAFFKVATAE